MNEKFIGIYELDLDYILGHEGFFYIHSEADSQASGPVHMQS